jgi:hypothetical protein
MSDLTMNEEKWIESIIRQSEELHFEHPQERELSELIVKECYANKNLRDIGIGRLLAGGFDLLVGAQYYSAISHAGWSYCPMEEPRLFFHYTNCCPRDVLSNKFNFSPSNKPASGRIGTATSRLLLLYYQSIFNHLGRTEKFLKGTEPVDAVVINKDKKKVLFAEIKASPLLTLPVSIPSERLTEQVEGEPIDRQHSSVDNTTLYSSDLEILVPKRTKNSEWSERYFKIGRRKNADDRDWAFRGLIELIKEDDSFMREYFEFWNQSLLSYHPKSNDSIFWLTNACGTPIPAPSGWPTRRRGEGYESVSDSKTSVGMDRTDDIKKGIYQVLKLGSVGKIQSSDWDYKVGLISNIHAARHFEEYLDSLKDVVWALDSSGKAKHIGDLPDDQPLYNLFDGVIALTSTLSRDDWIDAIFSNLE